MPTLREQAVAAFEQKQNDRAADARAALGQILTPYDVSALTVAAVDITTGYTLFVFTDGDVHLGVRSRAGEDWTAHLVKDDDGWTELARVESLAHLGELLPKYAPAPDADPVPAWEVQVAYAAGDRVTYDGAEYEVIQAHTSQAGWEPPNVPALWTKVV